MRSQPLWAVPGAMLVISLVITAAATALAWRVAVTRGEVEFASAVEDIQRRLETRLDAYVSLLRSTQGLFNASEAVTAVEFTTFVGALRMQENFPGIQGMAWCQRVEASQRDALVAEIRSLGRPGFSVWPSPGVGEACPIVYIEPQDRRNLAAVGFDLYSEPLRHEALARARDTGEAAATAKVALIQEIDAEKQPGFVIALPVYRPDRPLRTVEERRAALAGFTTAQFRFGDLVAGLALEGLPRAAFAIHDGQRATAESECWRSPGFGPGAVPQVQRRLAVYGRDWTVHYVPLSSRGVTRLEAGTLATGLLASALLVVGVGTLARARRRAEGVAAELRVSAAALRDREARLRFLADASAVLSGSLDHEATLAGLARLMVPALADWCAIDLADGAGGLRRLTVVHVNPAKVALAEQVQRSYPPRPGEGALKVLSDGRPVFHPTIDDAQLATVAHDAEHLRLLRGLGLRGAILVPLNIRGRVLGVISLMAAESGRCYDQGDLAFAEDLAQRAAGAVDHALLFEAERTARATAEEARRQLAAQADELGRSNAELEQFAYVASHDLQEPLRMVSSYLDLLVRRSGDQLDERARGYVSFATDGAKRMQELIKDLLAYSRAGRADRADRVRIDAAAALADALVNLRPRIAEVGGTIIVGTLPMVVFDRIQLVQVFQNLIGNALKFHGDAPPEVQVSAERRADGWEFSVRDNGIGIDPSYHDRIFDIFQRLHSRVEYPGTGIGLAICKRIIERHGGRIWVASGSGPGSVFSWTVPE